MKNIVAYLFITFLVFSCSTSDDNNPSNDVIPLSPTELIGSLTSSGQAILNWTDNATNETGFKIERKTGDGNYTQVGTAGSDATTFVDNGLVSGTTYTYRVLAYNTVGNSITYSNQVIITISKSDCDEMTTYPTVTIGSQIWMQKNLNVCKYRNGDDIPQVQDPTQWANLTTGAWCYVQNNTANGTVYGKMYNWYAVNDTRGLAPEGWHIPSNSEWTTLTGYLGGTSVAGGKMKTQEYWSSPNTGATNSSGFTTLPGGIRENDGSFTTIGYNAVFWSSTEYGSLSAWSRGLNYYVSSISSGDDDKVEGNFVRCVKN